MTCGGELSTRPLRIVRRASPCGGHHVDASSASGSSIRSTRARQDSDVHCRRRRDAGARDRRQHGHFQHGQLSAAEAAAVPGPRHDQLCLRCPARQQGTDRGGVSFPDFVDWREASTSFEQLAATVDAIHTLTGVRDPTRISARRGSFNLFDIWGFTPVLGWTFTAAEDMPGGAAVVVLSQGFLGPAVRK